MGNVFKKEPKEEVRPDEVPKPKPASPAPAAAPVASSTEAAAQTSEGSRLPTDGNLSLAALEAEIESLRLNLPHYVSRVGTLKVPTVLCSDEGEMSDTGGQGPPWDFTACVTGGGGPEGAALCGAAAELQEVLKEAEPEVAAAERDLAAAREALVEDTGFPRMPSVGTWFVPLVAAVSGESAAKQALEAAQANVEEKKREERQAREAVKAAQSSKDRQKNVEAYNFPFQVCLRFDTTWPKHPPTVRFQCIIHHALTDESDGMLMPFYRALKRNENEVHTVASILQAIHEFLQDPLKSCGIKPETAPQRLIASIASARQQNQQRIDVIKKYRQQAKHLELFPDDPCWREEWFDPAFWKAHKENTPEAWKAILTTDLEDEVFSFRIFTDEFCEMFVGEIFSFYASGLPARRPNSMNNYGIILNEIGLEPMISKLQEMLQPLGELLFHGPGSVWDGNHCFIVRYREGEDLGLDMHTDDSDVTFNICLGLDFDGAGLQFCGLMGAANHRRHTLTYKHRKGCCVFHLGRKRHGADDITTGERLNLILWNHSSTYRDSEEYKNPPYTKEAGSPDEVCVSYTHDRDFGNFKDYPAGKEHLKGRGWCPPRPYQYDGFKPDSDKIVSTG